MCGIWGAVNAADEKIARKAVEAIQHRGPDDQGVWSDGVAALGNTRLSIIDLSQAGHQPMSDPSGRYWIVYNGEVYNYAMLREVLLDAGHTFHSDTDTEVVLHAYMQWGVTALDWLRGMFAFAIWDSQEQKLFAARDRMGIKPLYYTRHGDGLIFGSEIKALLATGLVGKQINYQAVHHYLSFYAIPTPYTILEDVHALPPGHYLTWEEGRLYTDSYWDLPGIEPLDMPEDAIIQKLRDLLEESIRLRMIADVPVGAFLSGGIDSSAVVALMSRISGERLRTFSIGFGAEGQALDERSDARLIAERYNTEHFEVVVSGQDVRDQLGHIIRSMDQPTGDGLNTYLVSQATARYVKVALSGLGGDELFAGYPQFRMFQQADRAARLWDQLPTQLQDAASTASQIAGPLERAMAWVGGDVLERYERVRVLFNEDAKLTLYNTRTQSMLAAPEGPREYLGRFVHPTDRNSVARLTRLELKHYMTHTLLRDTDAMSMTHSLEVRVPLIDHKLVEFAARIPVEMKLRDGRGKWVLTEALRDVLPDEVITRPKRGFEMPVDTWLRTDLRDVMDDVLSRESLSQRGLFDVEAAQRLYADFLDGRGVYMRVWSLAVLELWIRCMIDETLTM